MGRSGRKRCSSRCWRFGKVRKVVWRDDVQAALLILPRQITLLRKWKGIGTGNEEES